MRTNLIKVGNSNGILLPKAFLAQAGIHKEIEMEATSDSIVLRPAKKSRDGWEAQIAKALEHDPTQTPVDFVQNRFDEEEWTW